MHTADHLVVEGGHLHIGGVEATQLADRYGTPLYVYSADRILANYNTLLQAMESYADRPVRIHYAVKANSSLTVMNILARAGAWADVVSPFEMWQALKSGFPKQKILYTGTSVSESDIDAVLGDGVLMNIDSLSQLERMAARNKPNLEVAIRWNPGLGIGFHKHVITAGKGVKFGIDSDNIIEACLLAEKLGLRVIGLHQHIGSGWLGDDVEVFLRTVNITLEMAWEISAALDRSLQFVNFGGGPGIPYKPRETLFPVDRYAQGLTQQVSDIGNHLLSIKPELTSAPAKFIDEIAIEPGRFIVGDAGILLTRINTVKALPTPSIGIDAGFNTLVRPALYDAYHRMLLCNKASEEEERGYLVAGNLCESGDLFNVKKSPVILPIAGEGDVLAVLDVGAYGYSMASEYNSRPKPAEVIVSRGNSWLIRERGTLASMLNEQHIIEGIVDTTD